MQNKKKKELEKSKTKLIKKLKSRKILPRDVIAICRQLKKIDIEEFLDQQGPNSNKNNNEDTTTENTTDVNTIEKNNVNNTEVSETTSDTNSQSDKTIETTGTDGN